MRIRYQTFKESSPPLILSISSQLSPRKRSPMQSDRSRRASCPLGQSSKSPILFRSTGNETPFSDQKWASVIGDRNSALGSSSNPIQHFQSQYGGVKTFSVCNDPPSFNKSCTCTHLEKEFFWESKFNDGAAHGKELRPEQLSLLTPLPTGYKAPIIAQVPPPMQPSVFVKRATSPRRRSKPYGSRVEKAKSFGSSAVQLFNIPSSKKKRYEFGENVG